jgi:hypothetical protein
MDHPMPQTFRVLFARPDSDEDNIVFSFCAYGSLAFLGVAKGKQDFQRRINCLLENYLDLQDDNEEVYLYLECYSKARH